MTSHQLLRTAASITINVAVLIGAFAAVNTPTDALTAASTHTDEHADSPVRHEIDADAPVEIQDAVHWALSLFEEADMELPSIRFNYHGEDRTGCNGAQGLHRHAPEGSNVELCMTAPGFPTAVTILHEFAHAWVDHNAGDDARSAFQELRGYDHWSNYDEVIWHENGIEQAAEIIVWGLVDRPLAMLRITQNSCAELEAGFVTLTGQLPLHGFQDHC
ncbi:MAG: hypothetical protein QNJ12_03440 [Ilumatobacter sp.]|uniref:hypothetical protein n=1 Tax=Ilumatobacter sp. TaxID=1967498 RepID=UPI0026186A0E|nr:hypothetical protein [Ilumatobacter sp.]MDJ0767815.1 hypothetical protein [Ilumatobacter sp.]